MKSAIKIVLQMLLHDESFLLILFGSFLFLCGVTPTIQAVGGGLAVMGLAKSVDITKDWQRDKVLKYFRLKDDIAKLRKQRKVFLTNMDHPLVEDEIVLLRKIADKEKQLKDLME